MNTQEQLAASRLLDNLGVFLSVQAETVRAFGFEELRRKAADKKAREEAARAALAASVVEVRALTQAAG